MCQCWDQDPLLRPPFVEIEDTLKLQLQAASSRTELEVKYNMESDIKQANFEHSQPLLDLGTNPPGERTYTEGFQSFVQMRRKCAPLLPLSGKSVRSREG